MLRFSGAKCAARVTEGDAHVVSGTASCTAPVGPPWCMCAFGKERELIGKERERQSSSASVAALALANTSHGLPLYKARAAGVAIA